MLISTGNSWSPNKVRIAAGSTATVSVELIVYKGKSTTPTDQFADWWFGGEFADAGGLIHFRPLNGSNHKIALNVPYYAVPTAVSNVSVSGISNNALKNGATDNNVVVTNKKGALGYADWFAWGGSSPVSQTDIGSADLINDGVQSFPNYGYLEFALQTTKAWTNAAEDYFEIDVDVDGDGYPDYAVLSDDYGAFTTGTANGEPVVIVYDLHTGQYSIDFYSGAMFNGTTMELPVFYSQLCMANSPCVSSTPITYATFSQDRNGGADEITNNAPFNVFDPSVLTASGGEDVVGRNQTVSDPLTIDPTAWSANPQLGILVLMQNNQNTVGEAKTFSLSF